MCVCVYVCMYVCIIYFYIFIYIDETVALGFRCLFKTGVNFTGFEVAYETCQWNSYYYCKVLLAPFFCWIFLKCQSHLNSTIKKK